MKVLDLAKKIKKITNSKSEIVFHGLPIDDPRIRMPDISKAKNILGWQPAVSLDKGLENTISFFKRKFK